ncbi:MAG: imidazole glycerol phosphate synthase subunit HisH [Rhodobacteraceae bacterium]|nr:imidazole glycerol phosphate synthase subunit HisH [Paracoccaceae bacterium]
MTDRGQSVVVVKTSTANLASVLTGLRRLGCAVQTTDTAQQIQNADHLVLPGVGAFGAACDVLRRHGLIEALRERIAGGKPTLAICLGMQLLAETSDESPGVPGLGLVTGNATRIPDHTPGIRVPQMGWNRVLPTDECRIVPAGFAYFANSYRLTICPDGWSPVWCDYAGRFLAAMEKGAVVGCQFHPELSSTFGKQILTRWLET